MSTERSFDYLIIGAGPAGLQLGYYLDKNCMSYAILEAGPSAGTIFKTNPRHGKLISINKVYTGYESEEINMRWDWNSLLTDDHSILFKDHSKDYFPDATAMVSYLERFASETNLNILYNTEIVQVSKNGHFTVKTAKGEVFTSKVLVSATGFKLPYLPDIPGIELVDDYTNMSVDPNDFINKKVLILGKGNSAFETSDNLIGVAAKIHVCSPHPVKLAWKTSYVGNVRAINNNTLETYRLKSQNALLNADILRIKKENGKFKVEFDYGAAADGEIEEIEYDSVLACTGFKIDTSFYDESAMPELTIMDRLPKLTAEWESTNVPGLYFAGTLMQSRDFKKKMSGFIHGFRYNVQFLATILQSKYENTPVPSTMVEKSAGALTDKVLDQVNRTSSLWQQPGYFCDLVVFPDGSDSVQYYKDLAIDYVKEVMAPGLDKYIMITLEFGQEIINAAEDVFAIERPHKDDAANAHKSSGIHPILRHYSGGELVHTYHVLEDFASEFNRPVHIDPLREHMMKLVDGGFEAIKTEMKTDMMMETRPESMMQAA